MLLVSLARLPGDLAIQYRNNPNKIRTSRLACLSARTDRTLRWVSGSVFHMIVDARLRKVCGKEQGNKNCGSACTVWRFEDRATSKPIFSLIRM